MKINDYVIYDVEGICKVTDVIYPDFAKKLGFVLHMSDGEVREMLKI